MKTISIKIPHNEELSKIIIGKDLINRIHDLVDLSQYTSLHIITDSNIGLLYLKKIRKQLADHYNVSIQSSVFSAGEQNKNLATVERIYRDLVKNGVDRKGLIMNVGGGVVTDLGGFVAATYLRGIDAINIPTSVTGMVDASIGGKTGIDFNHWKNFIGAFYQPKMIVMDVDTLKTLPDRAFIEGFAEVIKHGLIADKTYFEFVTSKKPREYNDQEMIEIIEESCMIKKDVIEKDVAEEGLRKILNFGHTVGHAVEKVSFQTEKPFFHGEAVAIGIIAESKISQLSGYISQSDYEKIKQSIKNAGLPVHYGLQISFDELISIMVGDKKNVGGKINWTLLKRIGQAVFNIKIPLTIIKE